MTVIDVRTLAPEGRHPEIFRSFDALPPGGAFVLVNDHDPKPVLEALQAERPGCFEWNVLEAGPTRWRIEVQRRPAPGPRGVGEHLGTDHRRLDGLFAETCELARRGAVEAAGVRFADFRAGLEHHIEAEEKVLFPAFEQATGMHGAGPTEVMRIEHIEIRRLMAEVAAALAAGGGERAREIAGRLEQVLRLHNMKEENVLYPMSDHLAGDAGRDELVRRMQAI
jgi:uncharacterized protein (DUF2249 family)/hemerythrin superfamily protein